MTVFYKIHNRLCPSYLSECLPQMTSEVSNYNLRNQNNYIPIRCRTTLYEKSFFPSTVKSWNSLDLSVRNLTSFTLFKSRIKGYCCKAPEYYNEGNRHLNIIHTRLRYQCSSLKADLFRVNIVSNTACDCGHPLEDSIHFFFECPLYNVCREIFLTDLNDNDKDIEVILFGNDDHSYERNSKIFEKVRLFIKHSKRF